MVKFYIKKLEIAIKRIIILGFLISFYQLGLAQNSLYVLLVNGDVKTVRDNKPIKIGSEISNPTNIRISENASITCIDRSGNTYITQRPGLLTFDHLIHDKKIVTNVTRWYFQEVYKKNFKRAQNTGTVGGADGIGGGLALAWVDPETFLGDILMRYPFNESQVNTNTVTLKWKQKNESTDTYYIFLRQSGQRDVHKFSVKGTEIELNKLLPLEANQKWEWVVSDVESPDLTRLYSYSFTTLSKRDFDRNMSPRILDMIDDLTGLGFNEEEIDRIIFKQTKGISRR